jgi:NAD(P)-dependent dehydrogenase (short-subunit alcohol dehydrogenase family)
VNAVNPGLIETQIARDVVNGDEQAYAELAKHVPIGRAGRPEEIASVVRGFAVRGRVTWSARHHRRRRDDGAVIRGPEE